MKRFAFADTTNGGLVWLAEAIETEVAGSGSLLEEEKDKLYAFVSKLTTADAILAAMQSKTMSGLKSQPAHESNNNNADTVVAHTATKETSVEEREINGETAVAAEPEPEKVDGEAENENVGETTESQETDEFPAFSLDPHFTENDETSPEDMPHKENVVPSAPIDAFDATFDF